MADDKPARTKRRIRESTETMRDRSDRADAASLVVKRRGPVGRAFAKFFGLGLWQPLRIAGRFLGKYLIPPYFKNSARELRLVTWPSGKQSRRLTFAVMIFALVFGVIIAVVDYGLDKAFKAIILNQ